jgi:diguanylate cyclase (GGDEF)-like protein/PAS domain S-box-containing protein
VTEITRHSPGLPRSRGEHHCLIHRTEGEARAVVEAFVQEGLRGGRQVLLIGEGPGSVAFQVYERLLDRGDEESDARSPVEFRRIEECFEGTGRFDRYQAVTFIREQFVRALDAGFDGLHLVQDMAALEKRSAGLRDLTAFEAGLNVLLGDKPCSVLCLYDRTRTSPELLLRALDLHPTELREGLARHQNPFYQPEVEFRAVHAGELVEERLELLRGRGGELSPVVGPQDPDALLMRLARRIDVEGTSRDGLARIGIAEIGREVGAQASRFYVVDAQDASLTEHSLEGDLGDPLRRVRGEGTAGRAWLSRRPVWSSTPRSPDGEDLSEGGQVELALPLLGGDAVRGVLEFTVLPATDPDPALLDRLEPVARVLGEALGRIRAEERLGVSQGGLDGLLATSPDGIVVTDREGRVQSWNLAAVRLLGSPTGEVPVGRPLATLLPPDVRERFQRALDVAAASGSSASPASVELLLPPSSPGAVPTSLTLTSWDVGGEPSFVAKLRDHTADRDARSHARLIETVASRAGREAVLVTTGNLQWGGPSILFANPAFCRMTGYSEAEILGKSFRAFAGPKTAQDSLRVLWERLDRGDAASAEFVAYRKDGSEFVMRLEVSPVRDDHGRLTHFVAVQSEAAKEAGGDDRYLRADRDALTGLANRALFNKVLRRAIERVRRNSDLRFAVLFLDLDGFKQVNDSLGHLVGDQLLVSVARRLEEAVRPGDVLVRFGGDEFVILLEYVGGLADVLAVADRIQERLARPFRLDGRDLRISASVGIALSDTGYSTVDEVIRDADSAMYRAKEEGSGGYRIFDRTLREEALSEGRIRAELQSSLDRGEFRLHYQPLMDLHSGRISGVEALLRWEHPERGLVAATEFISHAEAMKLILPLGRWVIRESCRQLKSWQERLPPDVPLALSLNLSTRELLDPRAREWFEESLSESDVDPSSLRVEVPESFFARPHAEVVTALAPLRELGVRIGIDDFGSGSVSVGQLHRYPVDFLKMDRQFIADLPRKDGGNGRAVRAILAMAGSLGLDVIAPGVETTLQEELLRQLSCPKAQGYLFSAPVDAEKAGRLLAAGRIGPRH